MRLSTIATHPSSESLGLTPLIIIMSLIVRETHQSDPTFDVGFTVDEAIAFIIEALEDPLNPRWCAASVMVCAFVIHDQNAPESLLNANHLFGSTIVAFLTAKRSIADIKTLDSRWSNCSCSYADITNHGRAMLIHRVVAATAPTFTIEKIEPLHKVVDTFALYFEDAVIKMKPFSVAKGRHPEIWPTTPQDLIPYGE